MRGKKPNLHDLHPKQLDFRDERDWEQRPLPKDTRDPLRTEGRTDDHLPRSMLFYRDYMGGAWWKKRKEAYYERHAKACKICGATTRVELHFDKYGHYAYEDDRNLLPLCRTHHQMLHEKLGVRTNIRYQSRLFVEEMIAKWDAEHEQSVTKPVSASTSGPTVLAKVIDKTARPVWKLIDIITFRKR